MAFNIDAEVINADWPKAMDWFRNGEHLAITDEELEALLDDTIEKKMVRSGTPCMICGAKLTDPVSRQLGIGPSHLKQRNLKARVDAALSGRGLTREDAKRIITAQRGGDTPKLPSKGRKVKDPGQRMVELVERRARRKRPKNFKHTPETLAEEMKQNDRALGRLRQELSGTDFWYPEVVKRAPMSVRKECWAIAIEKIHAAPKPPQSDIIRNRKQIQSQGRINKQNTGDRRASRKRIFEEFGGDKRGYVPCYDCGVMLTHDNTQRVLPVLERDKIVVEVEGGRYLFENLLPICGDCNKYRSDDEIHFARPVWKETA